MQGPLVPDGEGPPGVEPFAALPRGALVARYAGGSSQLPSGVLDLDDEALDTFFRPEAGVGLWSCRVLLGHLADAETAYVHRLRRAVAEDGPVVAPWDEDAFIDRGLYGSAGSSPTLKPGGFVAVVHTLRLWTAEWLASLDDAGWDRKMLHPERGEQTVGDVVVYATYHLERHAWFLRRKLERLGAMSEGAG